LKDCSQDKKPGRKDYKKQEKQCKEKKEQVNKRQNEIFDEFYSL